MTSIKYDSIGSITRALASLRDFHDLLRERHEAGEVRLETLQKFLVLGRYWLDDAGRVAVLRSNAPTNGSSRQFPEVADVLQCTKHWSTVLAYLLRDYVIDLPPEGIESIAKPEDHCTGCGQAWEVGNAHKYITHLKRPYHPLCAPGKRSPR